MKALSVCKKSLTTILVVLFLICSVSLQSATVKAQTTTLVVPTQYASIQDAINHANAGDTVYVKTGTYIVPDIWGLNVNKSICLTGEDKSSTIIEPPLNASNTFLIYINANNVTLSGFTIKDTAITTNTMALPSGVSECEITDNNVYGYNFTGISVYGVNNEISNNLVEGNSDFRLPMFGVSCVGSNSVVSNNTVTSNNIGIYCAGQNLNITQNVIRENGLYQKNVDTNSFGGIILTSYSDDVTALSSQFRVYNNNITGNLGYGVAFDSNVSNTLVYNNNIIGNSVGFYLNNFLWRSFPPSIGIDNQVYCNNIVDNNQSAIVEYSSGPCASTEFTNGTDVVSWDNGKIGNYWSGYSGQGAYTIDQNNIDHNPLAQQVNTSSTEPSSTPSAAPNASIAAIMITTASALIIALAVSNRAFVEQLLNRQHRA
jgi:parallel beta-helix repeat protein